MQHFEKTSVVDSAPQEVFDWHARPGALDRLIPPWQKVKIVASVPGLRSGNRVHLRLGSGPFWRSWIAEHTAVTPGRGFEDIQLSGPFRHWLHRHRFEPAGEARTVLKDSVEYSLPLGSIGQVLGGRFVQRMLERTFEYRHRTTVEDLALHAGYGPAPRLRVAVSGAGGLIGSTLTAMLTGGGHEVVRLIRSPSGSDEGGALWDPARGLLEPSAMEGLDAVVHLAGDNIGQGRWTAAKKRRIQRSRVQATEQLVRSLSQLERPPRIFVGASAVGIYGDRREEVLTEDSSSGSGFLAEVCKEWEGAASRVSEFGARSVTARFGVVLSPKGGALAKMLPVFRSGGGGKLGRGTQFISWISIDDAAAALIHLVMSSELSGPVNVTAPAPVANSDFTRVMAEVLRRPAVIPVPVPLARLLFGEMADATLLASIRAIPAKLQSHGFRFRHPDLRTALGRLLGRPDS